MSSQLLTPRSELFGREDEKSSIAALLAHARAGRRGVLVVRGEPGVGKTALLAEAARQAQAAGMLILSAAGVETEVDLPFAALHQLLLPILGRREQLPAPQRTALEEAFGLDEHGTGPPDRFLIALAVLTLVADVADDQPVLVLIDDGEWLDPASAQALLFIAHRLETERVAALVAVRASHQWRFQAPNVPTLELGGLDPAAADRLLHDRAPQIAPPVRSRLIEEVHGNPLALTELPATLTTDQLAGQVPLPPRLPLGTELERVYLEQVRDLPAATQTALLVVAAEERGDAVTALAAVDLLVGAGHLEPAERAGLVRIMQRGGTRFRHPLVRSAVYQGAPVADRQAAHHALAEVLGGEHQADRRAWHLAAAATGPDEEVAAALERTAGSAARRGGIVAAAEAFERAAALTPETTRHARRLVAAAQAAWDAGQPARARLLLDQAEPLAASPQVHAKAASVRGWMEYVTGTSTTACMLLADSAGPITESDPDLAGEILLAAARAAWTGNQPAWLVEIGERKLALREPGDDCQRLAQLLVDLGHGRLPGYDPQDDCEEDALLEANMAWRWPEDPQPWAWPPTFLSELLSDEFKVNDRLTRAVASLRARGAIGALPVALAQLVPVEVVVGQWSRALDHASEGTRLALETGQAGPAAYLQVMAAWVGAAQGRADCLHLADQAREFAAPHEHAPVLTFASWAHGLLDLGQGRPEQALEWLLPVTTRRGPEGGHYLLGRLLVGDFAEAASNAGQAQLAEPVVAEFEDWASGNQRPWAVSLAHRGHALLSQDDGEAERHFQAALAIASDPRRRQRDLRPYQFARTRLSYGEWLRRHRRRRDARHHLRGALETFERLDATPWAERARAELRASGETARQRDPSTLGQLTPQERQIATRAARGMTNREIGAELFLSPKTIAYHLHNVFPKLGIASRAELRDHDLEPETAGGLDARPGG